MEPGAQSVRPSDIAVAGGTIRVLSFGGGPRHAIAVHGITANASCWRAVGRALPAEFTLHAVDLRGRGHSAALPGRYGFDAHASDLVDVAEGLALDRPLLVGHSLGAYVALLTHDAHPDRFGGLLLLDGGLPMPVPDGTDLDELLAAGLGPAIARLSETYPSADAYVAFWRAHPALAGGWTPDFEEYVRYDLTGEQGALRSRVVPECVRQDGRELLGSGERVEAALRRHQGTLPLLRAPRGMFGEPPGMLPEPLIAHWQTELPELSVATIPDVNHYTMMFATAATAAIAAAIAGLAG